MSIFLIIKISILIIIFVAFSIKRVTLFITLLTITILLGLFFLPLIDVVKGLWQGVSSIDTLSMMFLIWLTVGFTKLIGEGKGIEKASNILLNSVKNPILLFPFFPALIGLFPMPGGALVSAPMLDEMSKNSGLDNNLKGIINFWFRHIWEPVWPLYPSIIFTLQILKISYVKIFTHLFFITIFAILGGFLFLLLPNIKRVKNINNENTGKIPFLKLLYQLWPIFALIAGILIIPKGIFYISILIIAISIVYSIEKKLTIKKNIFNVIKGGFNLKMILLIPVIFTFKKYVEMTNITNIISQFTQSVGLPIEVIIFIIPMIIGLLFGITIGFISVCLPLFLPFIITGTGVNFYLFAILFLGGYLGVYFSPMHLCLLVTKEYFNASLIKMYKKMILPGLFLVILSLVFNYILNK